MTLNNLYCAGELDPLGVKEYPELDNILTDYVSVKEAARNQGTGILTEICVKNKKSGVCCGSKCHSETAKVFVVFFNNEIQN